MPDMVPLDRLDRALLDLVQRDNQLPARSLAERVGLSESAARASSRPMSRWLRPAAVGLPLTVVALVSLEREGARELDLFARRVRARPEVRQCWYVTGEADWVLALHLPDMEAYEALTRELFLADANVRGFRTLVAMREIVGEADARPLARHLPTTPRGDAEPAA